MLTSASGSLSVAGGSPSKRTSLTPGGLTKRVSISEGNADALFRAAAAAPLQPPQSPPQSAAAAVAVAAPAAAATAGVGGKAPAAVPRANKRGSILKPEVPTDEEGPLPYGGDMQAALAAQNRPAIRRIMTHAQRAKELAAASQANAAAARATEETRAEETRAEAQAAAEAASAAEAAAAREEELPYGGDLQVRRAAA